MSRRYCRQRMHTGPAVLAAMVLSLLLPACDDILGSDDDVGTDTVEFRAADISYRADDDLRLTLRNRSAQHVGYNLCGLRFERRASGEWQPDGPAPLPCLGIQYMLEPGTSDATTVPLDGWAEPGNYRVATTVIVGDEVRPLSATFLVTE